jgi:hypothetical protein
MIYQNILSALGLIGIGAVIKSIIDFFIKTREVKSQAQHEFKNSRYKPIILLANALLDFDKHQPDLKKHGRDFTTRSQLIDELKVERNNTLLFASDQVIKALSVFLTAPSEVNYYKLAIAMRKDLYGLATTLSPTALRF